MDKTYINLNIGERIEVIYENSQRGFEFIAEESPFSPLKIEMCLKALKGDLYCSKYAIVKSH